MNSEDNFKVRCKMNEAMCLQGEATIDIGHKTFDCYCEAYKNKMQETNEIKWSQHCALTAVYMLGFLSGSRAIRERQKAKNGTKCN